MTPRELLRILGEELRRRPFLIGFLVVRWMFRRRRAKKAAAGGASS